MIFIEARFVVFFALVWGVHWTLRSNRARKAWLLLASCVFYGVSGPAYLALMLGTAGVDFAIGVLLGREEDPRRRRWILVGSLVSNLGVLGFFKYAGFFAENVRAGLAVLGLEVDLPVLKLVLPVGISFYTFQSLSYTIDVYRRRIPPAESALDFLVFVSFFPQLVAGPIVRAGDFLAQTREARRLESVQLRRCFTLFLLGFFKKACVADHIARAADPVFLDPGAYGPGSLWLAELLYVVQIYCDFSGYTDMAVALGGLLGYRLPRNFDFPYLSTSVAEYWRRWHISLSTWFRDYLYVPMGGSRAGMGRTWINLFTVFLLCGLWHGANWTFVLFGLLHGLVLSLERVGLGALLARAPRLLGWAWASLVIVLGHVLFRSSSVSIAGTFYAGMFGFGTGEASVAPGWWLLLLLLFGLHLLAFRERLVPALVWKVPSWAFALGYGAAVALLLPWVAVGYAPFLYFRF